MKLKQNSSKLSSKYQDLHNICERIVIQKRRLGTFKAQSLFHFELTNWLSTNKLTLNQVPNNVLNKIKAQDHMFVDYFHRET